MDMSLFDASLLRNEEAIEVALGVLESFLDNPAVTVESLIRELLSVPRLFEFIISSVSDSTALILTSFMTSDFPSSAQLFLESLARQLLDRFSLYLLFLPHSYSADENMSLRNCRRSVELIPSALQSLSSYCLPMEIGQNANEAEHDESPVVIKQAKAMSQRFDKKAKRAQAHASIDLKPFVKLGVHVPTSRAEADGLVTEMLVEQKEVLQYYFEKLRSVDLKQAIREAYIREQRSEQQEVANDDSSRASMPSMPSMEDSVSDTTPPAYPMVQPMKAALYFDSADGFGEWRILISTRADSDLRQMRKKNPALFKIVLKKIMELSNGHFSDDNQEPLTGKETDIPIFEAKMTRDTRLVYHIDCVPEFQSDVERQAIKIFGIYTHSQLHRRFWDGVGIQLGRKGKEYKRRCTFRNPPLKVGRNPNVVLPASFPEPAEAAALSSSSRLPELHKDDLEKLHEMLVLQKYVTFSQALLNSIIANQDVAHVFDVSSQEKRIIEHVGSCYVLGRSGTGKTTTMLFKMLGIERSWQACEGALPKPRQIFVTQSRVLAEKVQDFFLKLQGSLSTAHRSLTELKELGLAKQSQQDRGLVDQDEEIDWRGDLPNRYRQLTDDHFPLFVTFDQLCRLLEVEFQDSLNPRGKDEDKYVLEDAGTFEADDDVSNDYMYQRRASFVSYGTFLESYWPHFPQQLTKGLDPALVFAEFMGVIKGSEQALACSAGYLDQDTYRSLSHRTQATFANQRGTIYRLFTAYLKVKRERRDYDAADRTYALLEGLRRHGVPGNHMDFLYVDEAQDNLLIDALVLRMLCRNPDTGLFWAGDTAQTISIGSAFRFDDLKSFLYRVEANSVSDLRIRMQPQSFQLTVNYRSHAGIVNCAHSIVHVITTLWPHAIDNLAKEHGIVDGLKPVFFTGWDDDSARYEQFLFGESGNQIEFGAEQCILVRDDASRNRLRARVGDIGLIMTIYESKGLEFNDVLLYNFFADSGVESARWRVIFNALPEEQKHKYRTPEFDDSRHNGVCRELKALYVAITRARKNLWIADSSDKGEPMRVFWTAKKQIDVCTPGSDIPRLAMSSTPEEWAKTALELFNHRRYSQAMHCYERAGMPREKAVAYAYYVREKARSTTIISRGTVTPRTLAFAEAAEAFLASAETAVKEKHAYFRIAAECYVLSGDDVKAAEAYLHAGEYVLSAQHYRQAGSFIEAVRVVKTYKEDVPTKIADSIIGVSRLQFLRNRELKQARELFDSDEEALEYMDDFGLDIARATLLEELDRFSDAAELHLEQGRPLEAIRLFLLDRDNNYSTERAACCLLDGLWKGLSLGVTPGSEIARSNPTIKKLIDILPKIDSSGLKETTRDEISMFHAILLHDTVTLLRLGKQFHQYHQDAATALMCFDHVFSRLPELQVARLPVIARELQDFLSYARLLQMFAFDAQPCNNLAIRRICGFRMETEESCLIPTQTLLYARCNEQRIPTIRCTAEGIVVFRWYLDKLVRSFLQDRLHKQVLKEDELCRKVRALQPCLSYSASGRCNRPDCPQDHSDAASYDTNAYNLRVRICLHQILIYHTLHGLPGETRFEQRKHQRFWLRRLHEALHPPLYTLGSFHNLRDDSIPEYALGMQIAGTWALDWLHGLSPYDRFGFKETYVTSFMRAFSISLVLPQRHALQHVHCARCIWYHTPIELMRKSGENNIYVVHDMLSFNANDNPSLSRGILFIHHILTHQIPVDVGILCNFVDVLCALLIVSMYIQRRGTLNGLMLPRSWMMRTIPNVEILRNRDTVLLHMYISAMADLLERMVAGGPSAGYLLYEKINFSTLSYQTKAVFIARICKNLCLLGYNTPPNESLRSTILRNIRSVNKPGRRFDSMYQDYVTAETWDHLAHKVRQSSTGSSLDEMLQLRDTRHSPVAPKPWPNVRQVAYQTLNEIPALITSGKTSMPKIALSAAASIFVPVLQAIPALITSGKMSMSKIALSAAASIFVPVLQADPADSRKESSGSIEVVPNDGSMQAGDDDQGIPEADDDNGQDIDVDGTILAVDAEYVITAPIEPSKEQLWAATVLLAAYRSYIDRRGRSEKALNRLQEMMHRIAASFRHASQTMNWPNRYYKMLFLGPLPHLFLCLQCAFDHLHASKEETKTRLKEARHQDLEDVNARLTSIIGLIKKAKRLRKALNPQSELHVRRDLEQLGTYVSEVEQLILALPLAVRRECQNDLNIAIKGIVEVRAPPALKKPKPELNNNDIDD